MFHVAAVTSGGSESGPPALASTIDTVELLPEVKTSLKKMAITELFPVQVESITQFSSGKDVVVRSKTGSGKTLAFAIPIVDKLLAEISFGRSCRSNGSAPKCLILTPTRELAKQIATVVDELAPRLSTLCVYGGTSVYDQKRQLRRGVLMWSWGHQDACAICNYKAILIYHKSLALFSTRLMRCCRLDS